MTADQKAAIIAALQSTIEPTRWAACELALADTNMPPYRLDVHAARALVNTRPIMAAIAAVERIEVEG